MASMIFCFIPSWSWRFFIGIKPLGCRDISIVTCKQNQYIQKGYLHALLLVKEVVDFEIKEEFFKMAYKLE